MKLHGSLYEYDKINHLIAFSNEIESNTTIILVGGLEHNILSLPCTNTLHNLSKSLNFTFIIPQFRSHPNFGLFSIENDIEDLDKVIKDIKGNISLIGNSTGCQVILLYLNKFINQQIKSCFLQGPVSDTEYFESKNINFKSINDLLIYDNIVYTKERFKSLYSRYNTEDLFSSYLPQDHYTNLNKNNYKLIFVVSGKDEYVINRIDRKLEDVKNAEVVVFEDADHFLLHEESQRKFIELIRNKIEF